jgi:23S rRNA pseudouridine1911/1915/1917 synthase
MTEKNWTVQNEIRVDEFLRKELPVLLHAEISRGKIRRFIMKGEIFTAADKNSPRKICRNPSFILKKNSRIFVRIDEEKFFFEKQNDDAEFFVTQKNILFEDEFFIIVEKPAFLPTEKTFVASRKSAHDGVIEYLWKKNPQQKNPPYAGIMHRLDRTTSGALLFTKSRTVNKDVAKIFSSHEIKKIYAAVCTIKNPAAMNRLEEKNFSVENFLKRVSKKSEQCKMGAVEKNQGGDFCRTDFSVKKISGNFAAVECFLHTGRTHQIRATLSSIGLPVLGDELYGGKKFSRVMLHSKILEFVHPVTKKIVHAESNLPAEFSDFF